MKTNITILGGGIIGLACAYFLVRDGHSVRVVDRNLIGDSCAYGNAGYISPSHFTPLANPGMLGKGLRYLLNPSAPFYLKLRSDRELWNWLWLFYRHCSDKHVKNVRQTLLRLSLESKEEFVKLWTQLDQRFEYRSRGLYVFCQSKKELKHELSLMHQANDLGLVAASVSSSDLQHKYPNMKFDVEGGVYFADDAHVHPGELLNCLHQNLLDAGVEFVEKCEVAYLRANGNQVHAIGNGDQEFEFDQLIIASGCWSSELARQLELKLPVQAGKGYSITSDKHWDMKTPVILSEAAVAITPFDKQVRFGGTMELAGINQSVNVQRVNAIVKSVESFIPSFKSSQIDLSKAWTGLRPCSPDGLPLIGRVAQYKNLIVATGHAMLGLTLAPVTGKIVAAILRQEEHSALPYLRPDRFN